MTGLWQVEDSTRGESPDARVTARQATSAAAVMELFALCDVAKFYPVLSSLQRFWVAVLGRVEAGCGAEPFRLRTTASRRRLIV